MKTNKAFDTYMDICIFYYALFLK